mmetsp:Transcript_16983/g.14913  ORF Transcript_16983/g.14913 Transcript_16983/m.14913 type:complete len:114 (-) Transcript_16983:942-1283(-)
MDCEKKTFVIQHKGVKKMKKIIQLSKRNDKAKKSSTSKLHFEFTSRQLHSNSVLKEKSSKVMTLKSRVSPRFEILNKKKSKIPTKKSNIGNNFIHFTKDGSGQNENIDPKPNS